MLPRIFPIRYVCGFGGHAPDGLVPFDDLFTADKLDPIPPIEGERAGNPGAHLAVITWDVSADGLVPVGRSHSELIAGGLALLLEGRLAQDAVLLSTLTTSSFAGLAIAMVPWLLVGGTLALHQPFDPDTFLAQRQTLRCDTVIIPGPLVSQLAEAGHLAGGEGLTNAIGVWRNPERVSRAWPWRDAKMRMIDVQVFGEIGIIAAWRGAGGKPAVIPFGVMFVPRGAKGTVAVAEIAATPNGTVALRGPMVPRAAFPPGAERSGMPYFKAAASGFVDTGYACLPDNAAMLVTGPPPGIVSFGGYRFVVRESATWSRFPRTAQDRSRCCPTRSPAIAWPGPLPTAIWFSNRLRNSAQTHCWWGFSVTARVLQRDRQGSPRPNTSVLC